MIQPTTASEPIVPRRRAPTTSCPSYVHGQVQNTANFLPARIISSMYIVNFWPRQASSQNIILHTPNRSRRRIHQSPDATSKLLSTIIVCTKDEQYSAGAAETAVNNLRHSARAMMLHGIIPKRFWRFVIAHAAYINNIYHLA